MERRAGEPAQDWTSGRGMGSRAQDAVGAWRRAGWYNTGGISSCRAINKGNAHTERVKERRQSACRQNPHGGSALLFSRKVNIPHREGSSFISSLLTPVLGPESTKNNSPNRALQLLFFTSKFSFQLPSWCGTVWALGIFWGALSYKIRAGDTQTLQVQSSSSSL